MFNSWPIKLTNYKTENNDWKQIHAPKFKCFNFQHFNVVRFLLWYMFHLLYDSTLHSIDYDHLWLLEYPESNGLFS